MEQRKWIDQGQPQTLQGATMLCYLNAVFGLIYLVFFGQIPSLLLILMAGAAYGIANEWRWAYWSAVVLSGLYLLIQLALLSFGNILTLLFAVVLFALLVHPQSRSYQKIWFH
jgi:hypothetical protein